MDPIFEIKEQDKKDNYAKLVISPLVAGYGHTLGTALRRVLLGSLPGAAITSVKMNGVKHQFSTLKGMKEDVLDFLLNLKKVKFIYDGEEAVKVSLSASRAGEVKAGDIKTPSNVKVANPELVLANLSKGSKLEVEMEVMSGIGYSPSEERSGGPIGLIPMDASFSPVVRVTYKIEETRVGRVTNYDKLIMEVWTDGSIEPTDALKKAAKKLVSYFNQIVNPQEVEKPETEKETNTLGQVGNLSVEEIGLPTRVANALSRAGYDTVDKLARADKADLVKVRNLGEKSLGVISGALKEKGVDVDYA